MRQLGYEMIDLLVARMAGIRDAPAWAGADRSHMEDRLREAAPDEPQDFSAIVRQIETDVLPFSERTDHPRFFAYIPGGPSWPSVLGDLVASGANIFQGTWLAASGPTEIELVVLDWFKEWLGYPSGSEGLLVSGGSEANLTAIACARLTTIGAHDSSAVMYLTDQVHSSVSRAARILGFEEGQLHEIETDDNFRMKPDALEQAIAEDRRSGRRPFLVAANAGATNTGQVDLLNELGDLCTDSGLWLHVDAAYGGFLALSERGKRSLSGLERADSITLDPHKTLFQQWGTGCLLVRKPGLLHEAFHVMPDYLRDSSAREGTINFADRGLQLTRPARALKIWLSLKYFGVNEFRRAIDSSLDLAERAEEWIRESPRLELLAASLGIVCFRRVEPGFSADELELLNTRIVADLAASGSGYLSSTRLDDQYALRICVVNYRSTEADVRAVLDFIENASAELG